MGASATPVTWPSRGVLSETLSSSGLSVRRQICIAKLLERALVLEDRKRRPPRLFLLDRDDQELRGAWHASWIAERCARHVQLSEEPQASLRIRNGRKNMINRRLWGGCASSFGAAVLAVALLASSEASAQTIDDLYAIQGGEMFQVDNDTGGYVQVGANNVWAGATSFATDHGVAGWVIQANKLWSVYLGDPGYTELGTGTWDGPTEMTTGIQINPSTGLWTRYLWIVQDDTLWKVNAETGQITQLGPANAWIGATSMAFTDYDATDNDIFIVQSSTLWRVNSVTGAYAQLGATNAWAGETSMTAWSTASLRIVQGGRLWSASTSTGAYAQLGTAFWPTTTSMATLGGSLYIIDSDRLHKVNGTTGAWSYIGDPGEWAGPTLLGGGSQTIR